MNINDLLQKDPTELTHDEQLFILNQMMDAMYTQIEHQKDTIKIHEQTIKSHEEMFLEQRDAISQLQLAYQELCLQFDVVKNASVELGGGYKSSESGIVFR